MAQTKATGLHPSDTLSALLAELSPLQAAAVTRIVEAELAGQTVESLFDGPNKMCSRTTYYRKRGWVHHPAFLAALAQARREVREQHLKTTVDDAVAMLKAATPLAAQDLMRQIVGDEAAVEALAGILADRKRHENERRAAAESLGAIGTPRATEALLTVLGDAKVRVDVINALGNAAAGVNGPRRLADVAVLDRADRMTASKGTGANEWDHIEESELDQLIANLQTAIGAGAPGEAPPA